MRGAAWSPSSCASNTSKYSTKHPSHKKHAPGNRFGYSSFNAVGKIFGDSFGGICKVAMQYML